MPEGNESPVAAMSASLEGKQGKQYWRSLEQLAETEEFKEWVEDEFPNRKTLLELDRRQLIKYMGASMALAGLTGCRSYFLGTDKIVPYVNQPEELIPGRPMYYASTFVHNGYGQGVLVEQHEGRPTKIEGNPDHPENKGTSDHFMQASILTMYDPDRAGSVTRLGGEISTWTSFNKVARQALDAQKSKGGAGIRILLAPDASPTLARQVEAFQKVYPQAGIHHWSPINRDSVTAGTELAFGVAGEPIFDLKVAKVIVSLDADFLMSGPGHLRYAKDFADGRRVLGKSGSMNRLYAFEGTPTVVGASADHRFPLKPSGMGDVAQALLAIVKGGSGQVGSLPIDKIAADLMANRGASLVVAGDHLPREVHAVVAQLNAALGNVGATVKYIEPVTAKADCLASLADLVSQMEAGSVEMLLMLGGNPVYTAPADIKFKDALSKVPLKVHQSMYLDETGVLADWHLPETHYLEEWGDARAYDGTVSLIQPLIAPLFDSKSKIEVLASLMGKPASGYDLIRETYQAWPGFAGSDFEKAWRRTLHLGVVANTAYPALQVNDQGSTFMSPPALQGMEITFRPDPHVFDGTYSNNGWLQELPKPLCQITWENAAFIGVNTAKRLNLKTDDIIELNVDGVPVSAPVLVWPGHAEELITVNFGYGRTEGGTVATTTEFWGGGFNAYVLWKSSAPSFAKIDDPRKVAAGAHKFAMTQMSHQIADSRDIIRSGTLAEFMEKGDMEPEGVHHANPEKYSLYPDNIFEFNGPQWGMTIDMNVCVGCNACAIACQAENNISIVGKEQVKLGREMHWIRIDRYYTGDMANPEETVFQPIACVHCEKAPCEPVCPVAATVHSHEGLNQMVYNRCVGTRYCSNNCPYKVRRFNYKNWSDNQPQFMNPIPNLSRIKGNTTTEKTNGIALLKMLNNPDVTVRGRGVMEKCTYCTQRISNVRIEAKKQGREPRDGEILTACQQACPTQAITFGNVADPDSKVSKMRNDPRSYQLLRELQTRPRTSHMGRLRNPNPEITA